MIKVTVIGVLTKDPTGTLDYTLFKLRPFGKEEVTIFTKESSVTSRASYREGARIRCEDERCRINRVVRYVKTLYFNVLYRKSGAGHKQVPLWKIGQDFPPQRFCSQRIGIDRDPEPATENSQAGNMITVLVRNQNAVQRLRTNSNRFKALRDLARTESGVDEQPALVRGD